MLHCLPLWRHHVRLCLLLVSHRSIVRQRHVSDEFHLHAYLRTATVNQAVRPCPEAKAHRLLIPTRSLIHAVALMQRLVVLCTGWLNSKFVYEVLLLLFALVYGRVLKSQFFTTA